MNLGQIETQVYDSLNIGQNPDSSVQRRIRRLVNETYREVLTKKNVGVVLRRQTLAFSTSATSPFCVLPQAVARIFFVVDRTNNNELDEYDLSYLRYIDPGLKSSSAVPYAYVIMNLAAPVAADPAAATQLFVISDNAADVASVSVEGVTSAGQLLKANVAMTGTSSIALNTTTTWLQITKFYLSAAAVGNVSLKDSGGNVLGIISAGHSYARYTRLHMYPTSTAVLALTADVELRIEDMVNTGDEPIIPEDFHDVLVDGAIARDLRRRGKMQDYGAVEGARRKRVAELQVWCNKKTGTAHPERLPRRFSQLGPWFSDIS
jgi:hypothetical protein